MADYHNIEPNLELVEQAKEALKGREFANTKFLRRALGTTGQKAARIFRHLGWEKQGGSATSTSYKRHKWKWNE